MRDAWSMIGLSGSTLNRVSTWRIVSPDTGTFFSLSGSMAGAITRMRGPARSRLTNCFESEYGRAVVVQVGQQQAPGLLLGVGGIDVAAPDPLGAVCNGAGLLQVVEHSGGLRVVNNDKVVVALHDLGGALVVVFPRRPRLRRPLHLHALQAVVQGLGDLVELAAAFHDLPLCVDMPTSFMRGTRDARVSRRLHRRAPWR